MPYTPTPFSVAWGEDLSTLNVVLLKELPVGRILLSRRDGTLQVCVQEASGTNLSTFRNFACLSRLAVRKLVNSLRRLMTPWGYFCQAFAACFLNETDLSDRLEFDPIVLQPCQP